MSDSLRSAITQAGGLVNQGEIARRLGVSRPRAHEIVNHPDFPAPVCLMGNRELWAWRDVENFRDGRARAHDMESA